MKIKGEYIIREIAGEHLLVPVGETALELNGMVILNPVGAAIWNGLEAGWDENTILSDLLERFDVSAETAKQDMDEFLQDLKSAGLLE